MAVQSISVDRVHAIWGIDGEVGESSLVIPIRAAHPSCPSWSNRGGLVVETTETDDQVVLTASFPEHSETEPCDPLGAAMPSTVRLDEPLGTRVIIDGSTGRSPATPESLALIIGTDDPGS